MQKIKIIFKDICNDTVSFLVNNMRVFAKVVNVVLPFFMYFVGQYTFFKNGKFCVGYEMAFVIVFWLFSYFFNLIANRFGKGIDIPVPEKRFTVEEEDGEVTIEKKRLQELILYVDDVENWLERKKLLRNGERKDV